MFCFVCLSFPAAAQSNSEVCDNGIDDDSDGLIDLNDDDCPCTLFIPISLIPNPSFENLNCCPDDRSQLNCAEGWIQASEPTTDLIHNCGWSGWDEFPPPRPFPDGDGIMGFRDGRQSFGEGYLNGWKEYAGACLLSPLQADSTYRIQFDLGFADRLSSPPITITFFGTTTCDNLPFGVDNAELGCPTNGSGWQLLGSTEVSGGNGNKWLKTSITVTPSADIAAIAIGPSCFNHNTNRSLYYFFDNLILADIKQFALDIGESAHPCSEEYRLSVPETPNLMYQWYLNGAAIVGETKAALTENYGDGDYQVRVTEGAICRISSTFEYRQPVITTSPRILICSEDNYPFGDRTLTESGIYTDTFASLLNCDSIVTLELKVLGEIADTISTKIFKGESYSVGNNSFSEKGDYLIKLQSSIGCDSLLLLRLDLFTLFMPNIFSPNGDGFNDTFTVMGDPSLFRVVEINVYDRWGNLIFAGTEWSGNNSGDPVIEGVYVYTAKIVFNNGTEELTQGSVTLVR